jgi:hypothetical protein
MKIERKNRLPVDSLLKTKNGIYDFMKMESTSIKKKNVGIEEILYSVFNSIPKKLRWLLNFKNDTEIKNGPDYKFVKGNRFGPFQLFRLTDGEAILGINERNFDIRLSIIKKTSSPMICICFAVNVNNFWGKYYLFVFYIFYRMVISQILKTISKNF